MSESYVFLIEELPEHPHLKENDVAKVIKQGNQFMYLEFVRLGVFAELDKKHVSKFDIEKTGDIYGRKVCDRCFRLLDSHSHFSNNRIKKGGLITKRPSCKDCRKIKDGVQISAADRKLWEANRPLNFSTFTCPICSKTTIVGLTKVVLDHCHSTGRVRGWLCESCNTGIGRFDDSPQITRRALDWLEGQ